MRKIRLIARMDIKGPNLIKGIHLEGLRVMGDPQEFSTKYYEQGVDELVYMDTVASLYGRNSLTDIVKHAAQNIFVPMTVGGGIRSVNDAKEILRAGADKVAVNTAAVNRPELIRELAEEFGSQCVVLSVEAKRKPGETWEAYVDNGREITNLEVCDWITKAVDLGVGEVMVTSIDQEGTTKGFETKLIKKVTDLIDIPVIASGGMGKLEHIKQVAEEANVDAIAMAHVLHYGKLTLAEIRNYALEHEIPVRRV